MHDHIVNTLQQIESEHQVKILLAVESGSRAWGFASENSDWDVRFIYVHQPEWYLSVLTHREVIEAMLPGDLDLSGWELRKALRLFYKSNPPLLEWLHSPITYMRDEEACSRWLDLIPEYCSKERCMAHYLSMASGNVKDYLGREQVPLKKYLYMLRPLLACRYIESIAPWAPMEFNLLVEACVDEPSLKEAIFELVDQKRQGRELGLGNPIPVIDSFISSEIVRLTELAKCKEPPRGYEKLDAFFRWNWERFR